MSAVETSDATATNATATNATATNATAAEDVFFPPAPSPPPPGNITDPDVVWCLVNATEQPHGWVHSPPPAPRRVRASVADRSAVASVRHARVAPAATGTAGCHAQPDARPPSPPPPMYLVWQPCEDAAPPPPADTTLFGLFDYADATHQLYAALLALAALFLCFRARAKRFVKRLSRRRRALSFEQAVKRHASLKKVKAVFDDMEARHKAETGDYDSDDSAYYRVKVLGIQTERNEKSVKEERRWRRPSRTCAAGSGGKTWPVPRRCAAVWRAASAARVASYLGARGVCRRRARDSDSDSDDDSDSDSDDDEQAGDGDEKGRAKRGGVFLLFLDEDAAAARRRRRGQEFQMFRLTRQSGEERPVVVDTTAADPTSSSPHGHSATRIRLRPRTARDATRRGNGGPRGADARSPALLRQLAISPTQIPD